MLIYLIFSSYRVNSFTLLPLQFSKSHPKQLSHKYLPNSPSSAFFSSIFFSLIIFSPLSSITGPKVLSLLHLCYPLSPHPIPEASC